jgi:hypothetical protein
MSSSARIEVKNYIAETVEEEVYADSSVIAAGSTSPVKVAEGKIRDGYEGIVVGVACTQESKCSLYLKVAGKQYYPNGLNTAGLGGLTDETLLLVKIPEGASWELGFTNSDTTNDKTVNWRLRIRLFRKQPQRS